MCGYLHAFPLYGWSECDCGRMLRCTRIRKVCAMCIQLLWHSCLDCSPRFGGVYHNHYEEISDLTVKTEFRNFECAWLITRQALTMVADLNDEEKTIGPALSVCSAQRNSHDFSASSERTCTRHRQTAGNWGSSWECTEWFSNIDKGISSLAEML